MKPWFPRNDVARAAVLDGPVARLDPAAASVRACLFAATFAASITALVLPAAIGMRVNGLSFLPPFALVPSAAILWIWANWRGLVRARAAAEVAILPMLLSLPVLVLSYSAMRTGLPLQDARLEAWDSALGFHGLDFISWVNRHPTVSYGLSRCYSSFFPQLLLLPLALVLRGHLERAYATVFVLLLLGIIGSLVCMFFPAEGLYVSHHIPDGAFAHVPQSLGYFHVQLDALRNDPNFVLDVGRAEGIVAFPSGHAAVAVMCVWAAWPLRWVRWPILVINVGMFVSAVPQGAHYLVDLIAGATMAAVSIMIATRFPQWLADRRAGTMRAA